MRVQILRKEVEKLQGKSVDRSVPLPPSFSPFLPPSLPSFLPSVHRSFIWKSQKLETTQTSLNGSMSISWNAT